MHITDYLQTNAAELADRPAIIFNDEETSWGQLWELVQTAAANLAPRLDDSEPQIVGLLMANSPDYIISYLAIIHLGHIAFPVDVIFKELEIAAVVKQIKPVIIISDEAGKKRLPQSALTLFYDDLMASRGVASPKLIRLPIRDQVASLFFTSGTTGKPKAVPNTHANHIWNIKTCTKVWGWTRQDTQLISVRLSHMLGLVMGLSGMLYHGNTIYLQDRFDVQETLRLLSSGKIKLFSHGPLVYARLLEAAERHNYDLSKVRLFISGSGPLPPAVWQEFKDIFGAEILEVYGSSETGRIASNLLDERRPGGPGRILPGVEAKFDEQGQLLVRSDGVFPGYLNNPEATSAALTGDGFWKTGDIGELVDGRLVLKGRLQELIRKQGYSVSPRDVEWALHQFAPIKEVYVMGVSSDGTKDDEIIYFIVGDVSEQKLMDYCRQSLPSIWRPDRIVLLEVLPRTPSGKPEITKLRELVS